MKRVYLLIIAIFLYTFAFAQVSEFDEIKVIGEFLLIDLNAKTSVNNTFDDFNKVEKIILKKNLLLSGSQENLQSNCSTFSKQHHT